MTELTEVENIVKGIEAGGVDYVTNPISPDEVIVRIKRHIETEKLALSAQDALDHARKNVFCVSELGRLSWATLAKLIADWLISASQINLQITCFSEPITITYERQQQKIHLLGIVPIKTLKEPRDLKNSLPITKCESEVLYWVSYGKTSWEISQILTIIPRTVNKHLEQIFKKLSVDNRTSAVAISIRILEA